MHRSRPSTSAAAHYEALFQAASIELHIPEAGQLGSWPHERDTDHGREAQERVKAWWAETQSARTRDVAFFDERLEYFIAMELPDDHLTALRATSSSLSASAGAVPVELQRFLARLQLTMTASFLPPQAPQGSSRTMATTATHTGSDGSLATPGLYPPVTPTMPSASSSGPDTAGALATPNPFPGMKRGEEAYAHVEGITVWEGEAAVMRDDGDAQLAASEGEKKDANRMVFRSRHGWTVVWRGSLPIAYVRTPISNPLLGLTVFATLRDSERHTHRRAGLSLDTASVRSVESDGEADEAAGTGMAVFEEIDLLGGLGGKQALPASRLGPTARQDLCVPSPPPGSALPSTAATPVTAPSFFVPSSAGPAGLDRERGNLPFTLNPSLNSSMRKSYRRVLSLSSGLRVRMRNLVLPQLIAPGGPDDGDAGDDAGERKVVLCVEIENPLDGDASWSFEIEDVQIDIGGKGGKATAKLVCAPNDADTGSSMSVFPRRLLPVEQYNLLYSVAIASAPEGSGGVDELVARSLGTGETTRPVSITVHGRPVEEDEAGNEGSEGYPTKTFSSRWNCTLDLSTYFAETNAHSVHSPVPPPGSAAPSNQRQAPRAIQPNAIAGDKRYSLAALAAGDQAAATPAPQPHQRGAGIPGPAPRVVSGSTAKALMPSQLINGPQRVSSARIPTRSTGIVRDRENDGLLVSVQLLQPSIQGSDLSPETVLRPLEPFSIEVFVHNRTDETRRFRISAPSGSTMAPAPQEVLGALKQGQAGAGGLDDQDLRSLLSHHLATAPALLALENDVRCGPLLPGASLSARMRFLALRDGVHRIEKLRLVGNNEDFDHTISPVLDVVIGDNAA